MRNRWIVAVVLVVTAAGYAPAQTVRQLTDSRFDEFVPGRPDAAGTVVFGISKSDSAGTNPSHAGQAVKWTLADGTFSQLTNLTQGVFALSSSDDGQALAIVTMDDPLGTNHDASLELFLADGSGSVTTQLTSDPSPNAGSVFDARIAGSGGRAVFLADTDPLGTNPDRREQLFVVDADGTNLVQLTLAGAGELRGFSISDDGQRIVFASSGDLTGGNADGSSEVFSILADGSGLTQLTSEAGVFDGYREPLISGNGAWIVVEYNVDDIRRIAWTGGAPLLLAQGSLGSITNDGKWTYYSAIDADNSEIFVVGTLTGVVTQLTQTGLAFNNQRPRVSGANTVVTFTSEGDELIGSSNPDLGPEIHAMQADGSNLRQVTVTPPGESFLFVREVEAAGNGSRVVFASDFDISWISPDGSTTVQLTSDGASDSPSVSTDGSIIAFRSLADLTGQNPCMTTQVFVVAPDGTGLTQLTDNGCNFVDFPFVAGDGSLVVYSASSALLAVPTTGGTPTQIAGDGVSFYTIPRVSSDGQWVAYVSNTDSDGANPSGHRQVFRARTDGSVVQRLSAEAAAPSDRPSISGNGDRVVWYTSANPLGTNADLNPELFLYDAPSDTASQLTSTTGVANVDPLISADGRFVYFLSDAAFNEDPAIPGLDLWRMEIATGEAERAAGLRDPMISLALADTRHNLPYALVGSAGLVMSSRLNATGGNPDRSVELWSVDFAAIGTFEADRQAPSVVRWDVQPGPLRYDVIRGDLAGLGAGAGGTVDLGPLLCLEDNSPDNSTAGFEDPDQPAAGQTFFYLRRGSLGTLEGPGSWGQGSGGVERVAGAGGCPS